MSDKKPFILLPLLAAAVTAAGVHAAYRRAMDTAVSTISQGQLARTPDGPIEYGRFGSGRPVLVIHGAGGGFDQGHLLGRQMLGQGIEFIVPSRFGYLGSPVPVDASIEAQARQYAYLLDALDIREPLPVVAVSAGGSSGLAFARNYPERVSHLITISAITQTAGNTAEEIATVDAINRLVSSDFIYWLATKVAQARLMAMFGVPEAAQAQLGPADHALNREVLASMMPLSKRLAGIAVDQGQCLPSDFDPGQISAPTLVVHARDDTLVNFANAEYAADLIPGARLVAFEAGGHFLCGHHAEVRDTVASFIAAGQTHPQTAVPGPVPSR
jgi:2-hydroxy-6-oxonona-2,4-dienedioate hydrolase